METLRNMMNAHRSAQCAGDWDRCDTLVEAITAECQRLGINKCGCRLNDPRCAIHNVNGRCVGLR